MAIACSVIHACARRVRLRVPALKEDARLARGLTEFLQAQASVAAVRTNPACGSVTVQFIAEGGDSEELRRALALQSPGDLLATPPPPKADTVSKKPPLPLLELGISSAALGLSLTGTLPAGLLSLLLFWGAEPIFRRAADNLLRRRALTVDVLDASATVLLALQKRWPAAAFMVWLVNVADLIRELTVRRSGRAIGEMLDYMSQEAWVVREGVKSRIPVPEIRVGDVVLVHPGDAVPVDGLIVSGTAMVDEHMLTGESVPARKAEGDEVCAATVVTEGDLAARATRVGGETAAARIVQLVQSAPAQDTRIQNYSEKWANRLVPYSFAGAAVAAALPRGADRAAAVLIADYGTGIRVAAPTCVLSAMTRAARSGLLIKAGRHLEQLAEVNAVIFDKTGTLTTGCPVVTGVVATAPATPPEEVLALAAAAEQGLSHPVATAVLSAAAERRLPVPASTDSRYAIGLGVDTTIGGQAVTVGSPRFMALRQIPWPPHLDRSLQDFERDGASPLCVAAGGEVVGLVGLDDPIRPEAAEVVWALRQRGVGKILMLTGDKAAVAARVAHSLGIADYVADLVPEQKVRVVHRLKREGYTVAVVGDGINDSPALAYADLGIAVDGGTAVAQQTAGVVLIHGGLWKIPLAIDISRQTVGLIRQSWTLIWVPNTAVLALAALGMIGPVAATLVSNGSALLAAANSLRPLLDRGMPALTSPAVLDDAGEGCQLAPPAAARLECLA